MNFIRFIIAGVSIFLSACSGIVTTNVTNEIDTDNINKALITSSEESKYIPCQFLKAYSGLPFSGAIKTDTIGNTAKVIQEELKKFGVDGVIEKPGEHHNDIDLIIKHTQTWRCDMTDVLDELYIHIIQPSSNKTIAESHYKIGNREFHDFPLPEDYVPIMIKELMTKKINP